VVARDRIELSTRGFSVRWGITPFTSAFTRQGSRAKRQVGVLYGSDNSQPERSNSLPNTSQCADDETDNRIGLHNPGRGNLNTIPRERWGATTTVDARLEKVRARPFARTDTRFIDSP
jgi:hypothetical protein